MDAEPNIGNGADYDHFSWTQTLGEVAMNVPVPAGTRGNQCQVDISRTRLSVGIKGQTPILEGTDISHVFWSEQEQCTPAW